MRITRSFVPLTLFQSLDLNLRDVNGWTDDGFLVEWDFEAAVGEVCGECSSQIGCQLNGVGVVFVVDDLGWHCLLCSVVDDIYCQVTKTGVAVREILNC